VEKYVIWRRVESKWVESMELVAQSRREAVKRVKRDNGNNWAVRLKGVVPK